MKRFCLLCSLFIGLLGSFWIVDDPSDKLIVAYATIVVGIFGVVNLGPIK